MLERFTKKVVKNKSKSALSWKRRKGDKLYIKWKGSDNSFNSWIDKRGMV